MAMKKLSVVNAVNAATKNLPVTRDQAEYIYEMAKRVHFDGMNRATAATAVFNAIGVAPKTADNHIRVITTKLLNGVRYRTNLGAEATDIYLNGIRNDFGIGTLGNAVNALNQFLLGTNAPLVDLRAVLTEYQRLLSQNGGVPPIPQNGSVPPRSN